MRTLPSLLLSSRKRIARAVNGLRSQVLILTYHRVGPRDDSDYLGLVVADDHFAEQVRLLADRYAIASLPDVVAQLRRGRLANRRQVVISFDDGYWDNLAYASQTLRALRAPAVLYLATSYIGTRRAFWWDELRQIAARDFEGDPVLFARAAGAALGEEIAREGDAVSAMCTKLRPLPPPAREAVIDRLARGRRCPAAEGARALTWDEVRQLTNAGFEIGAHTCEHPALSRLPSGEINTEIQESKRRIEKELGLPVEHFSYPHDDHDYLGRVVAPPSRSAVAAAGFSSAVSVISGTNVVGRDMLALRRVTVRDWPAHAFGEVVARAFADGPDGSS